MTFQTPYKNHTSKSIHAILYLFITAACLTVLGCSDSVEEKMRYDEVEICSTGSDNVNKGSRFLTDTMFKMLGMLGESYGRDLQPYYSDYVESFGYTQSEMADYFEALMLQFRDESLFSFEYTKEISGQGSVSFYSTELTALINSFYIGVRRQWNSTLDRNVFCDASEEEMLSYIEGAYLRYGSIFSIPESAYGDGPSELKENYMVMTVTAKDKVVTIGLVLRAIGCDNVFVYERVRYGSYPHDMVIFEPTELVESRLGIERVLTPEELMEENPDNFGDMVLYQIIE